LVVATNKKTTRKTTTVLLIQNTTAPSPNQGLAFIAPKSPTASMAESPARSTHHPISPAAHPWPGTTPADGDLGCLAISLAVPVSTLTIAALITEQRHRLWIEQSLAKKLG
jgi:hypothetical protein